MRVIKWIAFAVTPIIAVGTSSAVLAKPVGYQIPDETAEFSPGQNVDIVRNNCTACHSSDYISTQPRGTDFGKVFWRGEVLKMINSYGAPIDGTDVDTIVNYLASQK
jgi:hypothetical protein